MSAQALATTLMALRDNSAKRTVRIRGLRRVVMVTDDFVVAALVDHAPVFLTSSGCSFVLAGLWYSRSSSHTRRLRPREALGAGFAQSFALRLQELSLSA